MQGSQSALQTLVLTNLPFEGVKKVCSNRLVYSVDVDTSDTESV